MRIIAYDPYVSTARAAQMGVSLVIACRSCSPSPTCSRSTCRRRPETLGLIGKDELATCKPGAILINAARGGLVDEAALADALHSGHLGGAGIDVYAKEPTTSSPLFGAPNAVVTPHLGASTEEAQEKAGLAVARSVRLALSGEFVPDAVNVQAGGAVSEDVRPGLPLAETLGQLFTGLAGGVATSLTIEVRGEIAREDVGVLQLAALKGVFRAVVEEQVTYVNAPLLACRSGDRGRAGARRAVAGLPQPRDGARGAARTAPPLSVSGTLMGTRQVERITEIDGYEVDLRPSAHLLFLRYEDRPGVVGSVGALLGEAGVNIASAQVSRGEAAGSEALMSLALDSPVPPDVARRIGETIGARVSPLGGPRRQLTA